MAFRIDKNVFGPQILMHDLATMHGEEAFADACDDVLNALKVGRGVVSHPVLERATLDERHGRIKH